VNLKSLISMKRVFLLSLVILSINLGTMAQKQRQGDIGFGPLIKTGAFQNPENAFQANLGGGLFGQYALNSFITINAEIAYEYRFAPLNKNWQYIEVPVLAMFKIGNGFVGAGLKYSQFLSKPYYINGGHGAYLSYLSAVAEISYQGAHSMFGNNIWLSILTGFGGYKTALRVGYGITPFAYNMLDEYGENTNYRTHSFFLEAVIRYDLASLLRINRK
jgi:hypothetical protein